MATEEPITAWSALMFFGTPLETPLEWLPHEEQMPYPLATYIPAAMVWIEILVDQLYEWGDGVDTSPDPAIGYSCYGGSLWKGKDGFSDERWSFWRERVGVLTSDVGEKVKSIAREAETMMMEIENGDVE